MGTFGRRYTRRDARLQKIVTDIHIALYRLSGGRIGGTLLQMPMLLLTTWGRKTGKLRSAPLLYLPIDGEFVLVASNGGAQKHPTWYLNLEARPEAIVQIGPVRERAQARTASETERARYWPLLLRIYPTYAEYQRKTDRPIPLVVLTPTSDALQRYVPRTYRGQVSATANE
jgi:F420H(2)-dependent quinone reductase